MIRSLLVFFIGYTFILYLDRPKMDRSAWLTVVGLTVATTLVSGVLDVLW